ncbi:helix-hairpin-helix domain-containing protein [Streptococcus alactolyticus]|uniref:helix-hairpin-helix domain-containing protein n=1 Tax=Streptococcus alactolyticus TaxID=29389 RepID=UPI003F9434F6
MAKKRNRKKEYMLKLKRAGMLKTAAASTLEAASKLVSKATLSLEEFSAISAVEGIRPKLIETLYNEGIQSVLDFEKFSEKEVLAFKGIGPATVNKLKENGVSFKA